MKKESLTNHLQPCQEWAEKLILRPEDLSSTDRAARDIHVQTCSACQSICKDYQSLKTLLEPSPLTIMPLPRLANSLDEGNWEPSKGRYRRISSHEKHVYQRKRTVLAGYMRSYLAGIISAVLVISFLVISFPAAVSTSPALAGRVIGQDTFYRANQTFWGNASDGQQWQGDANILTNFSIVHNTAQVTATSSGPVNNAVLGTTANDAEVLFSGSMNSFNDSNLGAVLRWRDTNNWYKAYIDGDDLAIQKKVNGMVTILGMTAFPAHTDTSYAIRFQAVGTQLSAKVWPSASREPISWMATASDSSFTSGFCGLRIQVTEGAIATVTSFLAIQVS